MVIALLFGMVLVLGYLRIGAALSSAFLHDLEANPNFPEKIKEGYLNTCADNPKLRRRVTTVMLTVLWLPLLLTGAVKERR